MESIMSFDLVSHLKLIEIKSRELRELISHVESEVAKRPKTVDAAVLTNQETEIVSLLKAGKDPSEICAKLRVTKKTLESHRYNIRNKLGLSLVEFKQYLRNHS